MQGLPQCTFAHLRPLAVGLGHVDADARAAAGPRVHHSGRVPLLPLRDHRPQHEWILPRKWLQDRAGRTGVALIFGGWRRALSTAILLSWFILCFSCRASLVLYLLMEMPNRCFYKAENCSLTGFRENHLAREHSVFLLLSEDIHLKC